MTKKKITKVEGGEESNEDRVWRPTGEAKGKATRLRVIAGILWAVAIAAQLWAINMILNPPIDMAWIIGLIVVDLALAIIGSVLWKKSNRLDPASEKQKLLFFMQNQLGLVVAIIAFLPLIVVILTNKDLDKNQKGILGGIAVAALVITGVVGTDFNPPSVEEYTEQTNRVEWLQGTNSVYWTKHGTKYHLDEDCHSINRDVTSEIFNGTVAQARELKNITELCKFCENRAMKEKNLNESDYVPANEKELEKAAE